MNAKKILTVLIFGLTFNLLNAQITITSNDLPQLGKTYYISTDTTPSISLGTPGPSSQSWNFSSLTENYPSFPSYGATALTPHAAAFTNSNLYTYGPAALYSSFYGSAPVGSQGMNNGYMFWKTDATGFRIVGFRADSGDFANVNVYENPMELLIGTPATYGTVFNNTGRWELPMNVNPLDADTFYVNHVTKTLTSDAWGSLTTPTGTFPNVLRIHEYVIKVDSAYGFMGLTPIYAMELMRDTLNNYIYLSNTINYPASIVHADKNNIVKSVEYYSATIQSAPENSLLFHADAFPNPFSTTCTIEVPVIFSKEKATITLFDITGREIYSSLVTTKNILLKNENYKEGIYIYSIENSKGEKIKGKLLIVK